MKTASRRPMRGSGRTRNGCNARKLRNSFGGIARRVGDCRKRVTYWLWRQSEAKRSPRNSLFRGKEQGISVILAVLGASRRCKFMRDPWLTVEIPMPQNREIFRVKQGNSSGEQRISAKIDARLAARLMNRYERTIEFCKFITTRRPRRLSSPAFQRMGCFLLTALLASRRQGLLGKRPSSRSTM